VKKTLAFLLALAMLFSMTTVAFANPGQNPNQNPGGPRLVIDNVLVELVGGGNNMRFYVDGELQVRAGNGTFIQLVTINGIDYAVQVRGNSLVGYERLTPPYECQNLCPDCGECFDCSECVCPDPVEPIVVNLGFIGHYFHPSRPVELGPMTTSFFWMTLNEGDLIDWAAVEAAYAGWVAQGGLVPDFSVGWQSSGFAPLFFEHGAAIGHGDFSYPQLEGFYRAYFVATGFILPYVCDVCDICGECPDCGDCCPYVCDICDICGECRDCGDCCPNVFHYADWTGRLDVQGSNNGVIVVTVNGAPVRIQGTFAQQAGITTVTVGGFIFDITANSNNFVTAITVTNTVANVPVVINGAVSLTPGNQ